MRSSAITLALLLTGLFPLQSLAAPRPLISISVSPTFRPDEALLFVTDHNGTTISRSTAIAGGAVDGSEWHFATIYRGEDEKVILRAVVVGEKGELLPVGPTEVLISNLRTLEQIEILNPRIAELSDQIEEREKERLEAEGELAKLVEAPENVAIKDKITELKNTLLSLSERAGNLKAEIAAFEGQVADVNKLPPRGFQSRLATLTEEIQVLASLASQSERGEPALRIKIQTEISEAERTVQTAGKESIPELESELKKLRARSK